MPTGKGEVEKVATPDAFSATVMSGVPPSRNVTSPVGVGADPVTVAVSVTVWPKVDGFGAEVRAVELGPIVDVTATQGENSDVSFPGSVAVAVTKSPGTSTAGSTTEIAALHVA